MICKKCQVFVRSDGTCPVCNCDPVLEQLEAEAEAEQRRNQTERLILANADARIEQIQRRYEPVEVPARPFAVECQAEIIAEAAGDDRGLKRFTVTYDGGPIDDPRFELPIVLDLAGLTMAPALTATMHDDRQAIVGHVPHEGASIDGGTLTLRGVVSGAGDPAVQFKASAAQGFPWSARIDARPGKVFEVREGTSAEVNGRRIPGPVYVASQSKLYGLSFTARATDDDSVSVEAAPGQIGN